MENKIKKGSFRVEYEGAGFHAASFNLACTAIEQYICQNDYPIYRVKITDRELRRANRELCGMATCCCGSGLTPIGWDGDDGNCWVEIDPDQLSEDWDEVMEED